MIKKLVSHLGEYKRAAVLTPLFAALEAVMDVLLPTIMAFIIDLGIEKGDMHAIVKYGLLTFLVAAIALLLGVLAGKYAAEASTGFAGNLRDAMYENIQHYSFSNIDKFSTAGLVTRMTTDVTNVQNAFQMIERMCVRAPVHLVFALFMAVVIGGPLSLVAFYGLVFVLAAFVPREFLAVAFDSGGVTTGPMTVPFIMALGVGVSAIRGDRHAADDSFGLVALCSVGPILAVLILGIAFRASDSTYIPPVLPEVSDSVELWQLFHEGLPEYIKEIASSLLPIVVMFGVFQAVALRLDKRTLGRIAVGLAYTYVGLVLFLTGANVGFMPAGNYLGQVLTGQSYHWVIIPIGMLTTYLSNKLAVRR